MGRQPGRKLIVGCRPKASCLAGRLSSNVRPHTTTLMRALSGSTLLALSIVFTGLPALGQDAISKRQTDCVARINERTAALAARDWDELERLAEQYSKLCKGVFSASDDSTAFEHVALANYYGKGNYRKALAANDACIRTSFSNSGCHVSRLQVLVALGRTAEARASYERVERLLSHLMESNDRSLADAATPQQKELHEAVRRNLVAQMREAASLKDAHFP